MEPQSERQVVVPFFNRREKSKCSLCEQEMKLGQAIYPVDADRKRYAHFDCYQREETQKSGKQAATANIACKSSAFCKHWARKGSCLYGDKCFFRHETPPTSMRNPRPSKNKQKSRGNLLKTSRATKFRLFLLKEYGLERLRGGHVLDIAGGKGELAFQLLNLNGIRSMVVEPRPDLKLGQFIRRFQKGFYQRNFILSSDNCTEFSTSQEVQIPEHLQMTFDGQFIDGLVSASTADSCQDQQEEFARLVDFKFNQVEEMIKSDSSIFYSSHEQPDGNYANQSDTCTQQSDDESAIESESEVSNRVTDAAQILALFQCASLVVGMHPDQATECIVDYALAARKPFAVVPCCVFHKSHPHRRLASGNLVQSYEQFLRFLREKDPVRIRIRQLDFEGRNKVVYCL